MRLPVAAGRDGKAHDLQGRKDVKPTLVAETGVVMADRPANRGQAVAAAVRVRGMAAGATPPGDRRLQVVTTELDWTYSSS